LETTNATLSPAAVPVPSPLTKGAATGKRTEAFTELGSEDFLRLLVTQLTTQDPLEPTGNAELLQQISSIRNLELSTTLTDSLRLLTGQQRFASASSLIGQFVTGVPDESGAALRGVVAAVRFEADGTPTLQLSNGGVLRLDQVAAIEQPFQAAERFLGKTVAGMDQRNPQAPQTVTGLVTAIRLDDRGEVLLELDTGGDLRFRDLVGEATE